MAEILPFNGVRYNPKLADDLANVICPPYDIITPQLQQELYHRSQYNFVRLEHSRELPQDTTTENKYTRAAATLDEWLKQDILQIDKAPAIYLHDHHFAYQQTSYRRRGITVRIRLEERDKMSIRPHEGTLIEPKADRLSLLWACQANTSPILVLYEDKEREISTLLAEQERHEPVINLGKAGGEQHYVRTITDAGVITKVCNLFSGKTLYIADGHHRYESALTYQYERRTYCPPASGDEPFNYAMITLMDFADPGLIILPPHRLVRGMSKAKLKALLDKLETLFTVEAVPLSMPDVWQHVDDSINRGDSIRVALFGLAADSILILKLKDPAAANQMMPHFHSEQYKRLDVSVVDHIILEKLLGFGADRHEATLDYSYERLDAVGKVLDGEYQLAFLLKPIKAELIKSIADSGDKMPKKSTYFYPKLPAGIVFYRLA